jgi:DNA-binding LytR/AlgR family response regulator
VNIALCDDDNIELENAKNVIKNFIAEKQSDYQITLSTFTNADDLLCHIDKCGSFDLLLLDIIMPGMNGIELATEIRRKDDNCKIIFLTSSPEFAVNSYKVNAFYYLLKPFSEDELKSLLRKVLSQTEKDKSTSIVIKEPGKLTRVQIHTIQYVESVKHTINFHLSNNEALYCYGTINEFEEILLSDKKFIRCHKSFIVNMNYVISISSRDFVLSDKTLIPISRQAYGQVKNTYIDYFFRERNESV